MCGLVAIFSKQQNGFYSKDKTVFLQMLLADMFRGMDSTGCFAVNKHGNLNMIKDASFAPFFINKKEAGNFFDDFVTDYRMVVGHNRKATMGAINPENAHPFIEDHICLVHNGTLTNHRKLADRTVDSNAITAHIAEHGYKSMLQNIDGAYALIWYDAKLKTVFFCRNSERPLYMAETATNIYLASEEKMLDWILDRNDVYKPELQIVPTDKVFKFNLDERKVTAESKPKKAQPVVHKQGKNHSTGKTSGQLALIHSSDFIKNQATIETYRSGETVRFRITDWDDRSTSFKIIGETCDTLRTNVCIYLSTNAWKQYEIDEMITAEYCEGVIGSVSQKNGVVTIWMNKVKIDQLIKTSDHVQVYKGQIEEAGGCCYTCGTLLTDSKDLVDAKIEVNSKNEIQFITCDICRDSYATKMGRMH